MQRWFVRCCSRCCRGRCLQPGPTVAASLLAARRLWPLLPALQHQPRRRSGGTGETLCLTCSALHTPVLQRQAQALIERFGMDPGLSPVLRELWLALVAHTRLLEPATIRCC